MKKLIRSLQQRSTQAWWPYTLLLLLAPCFVMADETEIFYQNDGSQVSPNVLFLLDASGSMDLELSGSGGKTRLQVMQETFRDVLNEAPNNINIGLMNYANAHLLRSYRWGAVKGVGFPVSPINAEAAGVIGSFSEADNLPDPVPGMPVRAFLADIVDSWEHEGFTPIVDSLYEATRYFRGEGVVWGKYPPAYHWAAHPSTYSGDIACENPQVRECVPEWGRCNGSEENCQVNSVSTCCEWVEEDGGGYCLDDDFSCSLDITYCEHTLCDDTTGSAAYTSPIEYSCQANYLVLMSDGKPEYPFATAVVEDGTGRYPESGFPDYANDNSRYPVMTPEMGSAKINPDIPALIGASCLDQPNGFASGTCGAELTQFLADTDQAPALNGSQTVQTYTVAYALGDDPEGTAYLASLATAKNGAYTADNAVELAEAFRNIFDEVGKRSFSFASPTFTVDADSLLSHSGSVYIPVFSDARTPLWSGNLRKFELNDQGQIVGRGGSAALNDAGAFNQNAQGLWSAEAHGGDVVIGGAASNIPTAADRRLWTDIGGRLVSISAATEAITAAMLTPDGPEQTDHGLIENGNSGQASWGWYTDCEGNIVQVRPDGEGGAVEGPVNIEEVTTCGREPVSAEYRETLLNFVRGYEAGESDGEDRQHMGDMLNTKPIVVNYNEGLSLVFAATNEGFLHAIDADTGVEQWAFMPVSLLKNQDAFFRNEDDKRHVYGLDGALTLWNRDVDTDDDGVADERRRYLYFGMRRGGGMYYALDITEPTNPRVLWKIDSQALGGADLGETWSTPTLSRMRTANGTAQGEVRYVLVFGAGYDPRKDEQSVADRPVVSAEAGSDVYIVDALKGPGSGGWSWSLKQNDVPGANSLVDSVPGDIRILDMDNNGELDRLYFADTGGNIWRVDMNAALTDGGELTNEARLFKFAELGAAGTTDGDRRKFFYEPDTALRLHQGKPVLTVSIGSGYRTHPLDLGDNDRFYVLLDEHVYNSPEPNDSAYGWPIQHADLMEARELEADKNILDYPDKSGWYYEFAHRGEKVLATSLTFLDKVIFTTFAQADESGDDSIVAACKPATTTSRAYVLDLLTAKPVANLDRQVEEGPDGESVVTKEPFVVTGHGEILDPPQLIFGRLTSADGGECKPGDCQQTVSVRVGKGPPLLSDDNTDNSNIANSVDLTDLLPRMYWRDDDVVQDEALEGQE